MSRHLKRLLAVAVLAAASTSAQAASCGKGTIQTVMIGAWGFQGIHIVMNHDTGTAPPASSFWAGNKIRFLKSDYTAENFKTMQAAILLAYANGNKIEPVTTAVNSAGTTDCSRVQELHLLP